ncbi:KIR protein [Plasmodium coatneyi]|uniref:KIR protein n=1 Tax=Plasmodium coatneyi TaxID=208452 RepID=A0A1B1DX19_9APIC|nr:KIR protein [Plasmodium coatneyi]ANQ07135.1 KIR protein [Plasmodium coatneyi]
MNNTLQYKIYCVKLCAHMNSNRNNGDNDNTIYLLHKIGKQCSVDKLPSQKIYAALGKNGKHTCTNSSSWTTEVGSILKGKLRHSWDDEEVYAKEITKSWCNVSTVLREKPSCSAICNFFYYWLGGTLCDRLNTWSSFKTIMQQIYSKLEDSDVQCTYISMQDTVDTEIFKQRKQLFDYYYDYRTILKELKICTTTECSCKGKYDDYLKDVEDAHKQVEANCGKGIDYYCNTFWNKLKDSKIPKPPNLQNGITNGEDITENEEDGADVLSCLTQLSSAIPELTEPTPALHSSSPQEGGSVAPAAVSAAGGLAAIGFPAVMFVLYKYNFLPNLFRKKLRGRSTRKRSSERNLDILMEDSTTGGSTIDASEKSSTLDDSTTVYSSAPYTTTTSRRASSAEHQGGQRNNIGYQNM